jgi:short-subunit dehydrogenase
MKLKNLSDQVILITGATSGIGLATARMAAEKGAKLVLVARNESALRKLTEEITSNGGEAVYFTADVADEAALRQAAEKAKETFGRIDTWVNNAGGSIYGQITDVPTVDLRRLFETNFWGVVNGSRIAVENMCVEGGAIINLGSEVSDSPIPLQGIYSASKHAVKGFTDSLRMELEADHFPISVTLIKPAAINTPFAENAKNYLSYEPQLPQPLYTPELVAEAILHCAEHKTRDMFVGGMAKIQASITNLAPRLDDKLKEWSMDSMQNSGEKPLTDRPDGLHESNSKLNVYGSEDRFMMTESLYQRAKLNPLVTKAIAVGGGLAIGAALWKARNNFRASAQTDKGAV